MAQQDNRFLAKPGAVILKKNKLELIDFYTNKGTTILFFVALVLVVIGLGGFIDPEKLQIFNSIIPSCILIFLGICGFFYLFTLRNRLTIFLDNQDQTIRFIRQKGNVKTALLNYQFSDISSIQKVHFKCKHLSSSMETKSIIQDRYAIHLCFSDGKVIRIGEGTNQKFSDEQGQKIVSYLKLDSLETCELTMETSEDLQRFKEKNG
jgi:hypothetical protein